MVILRFDFGSRLSWTILPVTLTRSSFQQAQKSSLFHNVSATESQSSMNRNVAKLRIHGQMRCVLAI